MKQTCPVSVFPLVWVVLFLSFGCGPYEPSNYPQTVPCHIAVTKKGKPLEGVAVILVSSVNPPGLVSAGMTDSDGIAHIFSDFGNFPRTGAPQGEYKVCLVKENIPINDKTREERLAMTNAQRDAYEVRRAKKREAMPPIVPPRLSSPATTPLTFSLTESQSGLSIEVDDY
ncbi:MAG TPA: hypothetical protein DEB39_01190 [Planctomycetaceae bacterium]|nr:hypothetical protein [Planctomycetaceae bacterium]